MIHHPAVWNLKMKSAVSRKHAGSSQVRINLICAFCSLLSARSQLSACQVALLGNEIIVIHNSVRVPVQLIALSQKNVVKYDC